ncbi:MAG: hypothetical protein IPO72_09050 [Saprospiraceae bacterium]|nr:hypothetical protein [Candidatus Vicinibacter affinis]
MSAHRFLLINGKYISCSSPMSKTITDALVWSSAGSSSSLWGKGDIREWAFLPGSDRAQPVCKI